MGFEQNACWKSLNYQNGEYSNRQSMDPTPLEAPWIPFGHWEMHVNGEKIVGSETFGF
jgi:hypothetical protein